MRRWLWKCWQKIENFKTNKCSGISGLRTRKHSNDTSAREYSLRERVEVTTLPKKLVSVPTLLNVVCGVLSTSNYCNQTRRSDCLTRSLVCRWHCEFELCRWYDRKNIYRALTLFPELIVFNGSNDEMKALVKLANLLTLPFKYVPDPFTLGI